MSDAARQSVMAIILGWYLAWSVIAFFLFARDKRAARLGRRREPESRLHVLELLGGFPGAFLAIFMLRHKSSKPTFLFVTLLVSLINIGVLYLVLTNVL
jgi:uncharacterized membrane protein YsdA (DUF1294 family)